jgi:hypothetical protein
MKISDIPKIKKADGEFGIIVGGLSILDLVAIASGIWYADSGNLFFGAVISIIIALVVWKSDVISIPNVADGLWTFDSKEFRFHVPIGQYLLVKKRYDGDKGAEWWFEEKFRQLIDREVIVP